MHGAPVVRIDRRHLHQLGNADQRARLEAELGLQFSQGAQPPGAALHAVHGDQQPHDRRRAVGAQQLHRLPLGAAVGDHVVDNQHAVFALRFAAHQDARLAVLFGLLAVEGVGDRAPEQPGRTDGGGHRQGNRLVGGAEQAPGPLVREVFCDALRVAFRQGGELVAAVNLTQVDEVGRDAPALGSELAEPNRAPILPAAAPGAACRPGTRRHSCCQP